MTTNTRERLDEQARANGWTHRLKGKSRDPYLKINYEYEGGPHGATFTDMNQQFHFHFWDKVVEL